MSRPGSVSMPPGPMPPQTRAIELFIGDCSVEDSQQAPQRSRLVDRALAQLVSTGVGDRSKVSLQRKIGRLRVPTSAWQGPVPSQMDPEAVPHPVVVISMPLMPPFTATRIESAALDH